MNIQLLDKSYLTEITVPASSTAQQFLFPVLNNLDGKFTQGLSTYPVEHLPKAPSAAAVVQLSLLKSAFAVLFVEDKQEYWNIPLIDLVTVRSNLSTSTTPYNQYAIEFNNKQIIWAKSYVFVADVTTIPASASVFVFNIKYTDGVQKKESRTSGDE